MIDALFQVANDRIRPQHSVLSLARWLEVALIWLDELLGIDQAITRTA